MIRNCLIILTMIILTTSIAFADTKNSIFTVNYAKASPIKTLSLKNTKLRLLIHYHGIPKGYVNVTTDNNQQFSFNAYKNAGVDLELELVMINDENKLNMHCHGTTTIADSHQLQVICKPTNHNP